MNSICHLAPDRAFLLYDASVLYMVVYNEF
jgi:hypothetical protein